MDDLDLELRKEHKKRYLEITKKVERHCRSDSGGLKCLSLVNYSSGVKLSQAMRNYVEHAKPDMLGQ